MIPAIVGEWWETARKMRIKVVGQAIDGCLLLEFKSGVVTRDNGNWDGCVRLIGCTGWDWVKPTAVPRKERLWIVKSLTGVLSEKWIEVGINFHIACAALYKTTEERMVE